MPFIIDRHDKPNINLMSVIGWKLGYVPVVTVYLENWYLLENNTKFLTDFIEKPCFFKAAFLIK